MFFPNTPKIHKEKALIKANEGGYIVLIVLAFAGIFITIISGLAGFVALQNEVGISKQHSERAFHIAEGGVEYYKWFLADNPGDLTDGIGGAGPYVHTFTDPEEGDIGTFSLGISGNQECNQTTSIDITSTGRAEGHSDLDRTVKVRHTRPSVAEYAYIIGANVWAGSDREISGRYHSNGGIRMDGTNNSLVTSAVATWDDSFDCDDDGPSPGVCGDGPNSNLWQYPEPEISFDVITDDSEDLEDYAENEGGLHFGSAGGESGKRGYRADFQADGTVDIYKVENTDGAWGYSSMFGWEKDYHQITNETFLGNYDIPDSCALIFFRDKLWIEGIVKGKVTVVAADYQQTQWDADIILSGDISYASGDGTDGLTAIAERSVLIPLNSPDVMSVRGIFVAQEGRFGRNYYSSTYSPEHKRDSLTINGTIVSSGRVGTKWSCSGSYCSGYENRVNSYDRALAQDPPPFTPAATTTHMFTKWEEVE